MDVMKNESVKHKREIVDLKNENSDLYDNNERIGILR